jgi:hypothetical protein
MTCSPFGREYFSKLIFGTAAALDSEFWAGQSQDVHDNTAAINGTEYFILVSSFRKHIAVVFRCKGSGFVNT